MIDLNIIKNILKESGYKLTNQRKAIVEVLLENQGHFLSVDDIYLKTKEKYSQTNLSTVYRNLEILEEVKIVHKTSLDGNSASYAIWCESHHHHHIICKGCGKTEIIEFCPFEDMKSKFSNEHFVITDHKIELYGYCDKCAKKGKDK